MDVILLFIFVIISDSIQTAISAECSPGQYGPSCKDKCGNCLGGNSSCHPATGQCLHGCSAGYMRDTCKTPCRRGFYGSDCAEKCPPRCQGANCHHVDGSCRDACVEGYTGRWCEKVCSAGKFGAGCANKCKCAEGCACDPTNGECLQKGCKEKSPRNRRAAKGKDSKPRVKEKIGKTGQMCSDVEQSFQKLRNKINQRVNIPLWPMFLVMGVSTLIIFTIGAVQMYAEFKREIYVKRWERDNIIQPLHMRAVELAEEVNIFQETVQMAGGDIKNSRKGNKRCQFM